MNTDTLRSLIAQVEASIAEGGCGPEADDRLAYLEAKLQESLDR